MNLAAGLLLYVVAAAPQASSAALYALTGGP